MTAGVSEGWEFMEEVLATALWALNAGTQGFQVAGYWGAAAMTLLFALGAMTFIPRPMLCILAGATYGFWGIPVAILGTTLGAAGAFSIGRSFGTRFPFVCTGSKVARSILATVHVHGWKLVVLLRIAPLAPASIQSFVFGLSSLNFVPFIAATFFGIVPGIIIEVGLGAVADSGLRGELSAWQTGLFILGIGASIVVLFLIARHLRSEMRAAAFAEEIE